MFKQFVECCTIQSSDLDSLKNKPVNFKPFTFAIWIIISFVCCGTGVLGYVQDSFVSSVDVQALICCCPFFYISPRIQG